MPSNTPGCFSWLCRKKSKPEPRPRKLSEKDLGLEESCIVPSSGAYAFEAGKQTVQVLQRFGNLLPVPCANEALELALLLMTTYEDVTLMEQQVKDVNNRIGSLMLVMVHELSGKEPTDISTDVLSDIERLSSDLRVIQKDLDKIASQSRWLLIFFKNVNKSTMDECIGRLNNSLQNFQIGRTIHNSNVLFEIQSRLQAMSKTTKEMANQVNDIHSWLKPKNAHGATGLSLEAMPPPLAHMYGRDHVIKDIVHIITTQDKPRVVIHGAGGMGKTSVAVSVMENEAVGRRYDSWHRFWVPCIGAKSPATFLDILSKSLRVTQDTGDPFRDLVSALEASKEPRLILLDNFETALSLPEDPGCISVERILDRLATIPHVAILVTIRTNTLSSDSIEWTLVNLEGVARDDALAIFTGICPSARDHPALDPLLDALGYMPYAVTLLARQAIKSGLSPDVLLEQWLKHGPNSLSGELKRKMNTSIAFSVESRSMSEDTDAQALLGILSKLPSGTNSKHLKWWAHSVKNPYGAIATLSDTALIAQHRADSISTYCVLPVVQSYLSEQPLYNSPRVRSLVLTACCRFILDHKSSPGDEYFKAHQDALTAEKTNILSILLAVNTSSFSEPEYAVEKRLVLDAMLAFCWFQFWKKRSVELLKHLLGLLSPDGDTSSLRYTAEARFCLGKMYTKLGRYNEACTELEAARSCFCKLGTPSDIIRAGDSALELATAWGFTQVPGDRIARLINEAQTDLKDDPKAAARALMSLGHNYWYMGMRPKGLEQLKIALAALQKLNCTAEVAQCLFTMSRCYASQKALPEWRRAAQDSLVASRLVGMNDLIAQALRSLSRCYILQEQYDDALVTLQETLGISEQLGHPLAIAQVLELSGYAYAKKQDFVGARSAYEEAKKVYCNMERTYQTEVCEDVCGRNIRRILESDSNGDVELDPPMLY